MLMSAAVSRFPGSTRTCTRGVAVMAATTLVAAALATTTTRVAAQIPADSLVRAFPWRSIGPSNMMGRISAVDALNDDWRVVLIGSASGGVWKSTDAGSSFDPIFDGYGSQSIGDVAFFQGDPDIIWVGTGEATNRNSVSWGDGLWKSTDGGATFANVGLRDSYQIAEVVPHPTNRDVVYVAVIGNLWGFNGSRGLFKTVDGGATWQKLVNGLPDDGRVGATDVILDPSNPETVYVGMYTRIRRPWHMQSGGAEGGIYKSTDGGASFRKLTSGLPAGETGMIDIDVYRRDPRILVAFVEADETLALDLSVPGPGIYRSDDAGETWRYLARNNSRPHYHGNVRIHPTDEQRIYVPSRQYMHSTDGGRTWDNGKGFPSAGGDDHDLWISPTNPDVFYAATDQGANVTMGGPAIQFQNMAIGQYYAIGVDHRDPYWVYGGLQDNGGWAIPSHVPEMNSIGTQNAIEINGGDGFHMDTDPADWRTLYTAVHVGFFGRMDMETGEQTLITPTPETTVNFAEHYDPDFDDDQIDWTINPQENWLGWGLPQRTINGANLPPQFRWNWNPPLVVSPQDGRTIYVGSSYLFKSTDRGDTWRIVSPDLTKNDPNTRNKSESGGLVRDVTGADAYNTIYTIGPSPVDDAIIWVGTDDGNVQVTRDGGATWTNTVATMRLADGSALPDTIWVSRVTPSHHDRATAYVTFDNHRMGDMRPYVFRTRDFGATWEDLTANLPTETPGLGIHLLVEDHHNPNLLFLGTEFGVWYSIDGGARWTPFMNGLPRVAAYDLLIHPRDNDLVAGTHGRSIWIADDISPLQQLTPEIMAVPLHAFENPVATKWAGAPVSEGARSINYRGQNPPSGAAIDFWLGAAPQGEVRIEIEDPASGRVSTVTLGGQQAAQGGGRGGRGGRGGGGGFGGRSSAQAQPVAGINRARWDMTFDPPAAAVTAYRTQLETAHATTVAAVRASRTQRHLAQIVRELESRETAVHDDLETLRASLLQRLDAVGTQLRQARSAQALNNVRNQLIRYSQAVGDGAYMGLYGEELRPMEAAPGEYGVRITANGRTVEGIVRVREDPRFAGRSPR
jgi:photosystem II stability/assembly factor-like uncharacterized protein